MKEHRLRVADSGRRRGAPGGMRDLRGVRRGIHPGAAHRRPIGVRLLPARHGPVPALDDLVARSVQGDPAFPAQPVRASLEAEADVASTAGELGQERGAVPSGVQVAPQSRTVHEDDADGHAIRGLLGLAAESSGGDEDTLTDGPTERCGRPLKTLFAGSTPELKRRLELMACRANVG